VDESDLMLFDKLIGELNPLHLPWSTTAAVALGNHVCIAGTIDRQPILVNINLIDKQLSWGKILHLPRYSIIDLGIGHNGNLITAMVNRNPVRDGSVVIEERDINSGEGVSAHAYFSGSDAFAEVLKDISFLDQTPYVTGKYSKGSQIATFILKAAQALTQPTDYYLLSPAHPTSDDLDQPLGMVARGNRLCVLIKSRRGANYYSQIVKLQNSENRLTMSTSESVKSSSTLSAVAFIDPEYSTDIAVCGQSSAPGTSYLQLIINRLNAQGKRTTGLRISDHQYDVSCTSITQTAGGVIVTAEYHRSIFTVFIDKATFTPAPLPAGFEATLDDVTTFGLSDLKLSSFAIQGTEQAALSYDDFSVTLKNSSHLVESNQRVPSEQPSHSPSPPPSIKPSPQPTSPFPTPVNFTVAPTQPTGNPTGSPTPRFRGTPTNTPTEELTQQPSQQEKVPSADPTRRPSRSPVTRHPTTERPTSTPTETPTLEDGGGRGYQGAKELAIAVIAVFGVIAAAFFSVGYFALDLTFLNRFFSSRHNRVAPIPDEDAKKDIESGGASPELKEDDVESIADHAESIMDDAESIRDDAQSMASYTESVIDDAESITNDEPIIDNVVAVSEEDASFLASASSYDSDDSDLSIGMTEEEWRRG